MLFQQSACTFYDLVKVYDALGERTVESILELNPLQARTIDRHLVFSNPKFIGLNGTAAPIRIKVSKGGKKTYTSCIPGYGEQQIGPVERG